ncbi:MAG: GDSL-type esterase/lipase family protein [Bacteroidaceae bacterium]
MKKRFFVFYCMVLPMLLNAQKGKNETLNIVFIGNSITYGALLQHPALEAPPVQTKWWLQQHTPLSAVNISNQGVSGLTTVDFLPESQSYFKNVLSAANTLRKNTKGTLLFSIMLGTNDSAIKGPNGSPVSPLQYHTNLKRIIDELLSLYPHSILVLHRPIWYSPNTYNGAMYLKEGLRRLTRYLPQLKALVNDYRVSHPNRVFMGDTKAFDYYKKNYRTTFTPEKGNAGTFYLHPNKTGATKLGEFWGKAIYNVIQK